MVAEKFLDAARGKKPNAGLQTSSQTRARPPKGHQRIMKTALDRATSRMPLTGLTLGDVIDVVSDLMAEQKRELVLHMNRMVTLTKMSTHDGDLQDKRFHERITHLEGEFRLLKRGRR